MRNGTNFSKKVRECNPQISDVNLALLQEAYEAGIVEGRIREKDNRIHMTSQVKRILTDFHDTTQRDIFELTDYQDCNWPFKFK